MSPDLEERRGEYARQILDAEIYQEAYKTIEDRIIGQLSLAETTAERGEHLRQLLVAHRKMKQYMQQVLATGTMAALEEERKATWADKLLRRA